VQTSRLFEFFASTHQLAIERTPQGQELIVFAGGGTVSIWNMSGQPVGSPFKVGHYVSSVSLVQRDDQLIVLCAGSEEEENGAASTGILSFWTLEGKEYTKPVHFPTGVLEAHYSPGGSMIAAIFDGQLRFIDESGKDVLPEFHLDMDRARGGFAIDPGGTRIAVAGASSASRTNSDKLHVLDISSAFDAVNQPLDPNTPGNPDEPMAAQFSPKENLLATGTYQGNVELWSIDDGNVSLQRTLAPPSADLTPGAYRQIEALAFDGAGKRIAAIDGYDAVLVWNTSGQPGAYLPPLHADRAGSIPSSYQMRFSSDGQSLVYTTPTGVFSRSLGSGNGHSILQDVLIHRAAAIALSSDGATVAAGMQGDNTVRIWDIEGKQKGPALHLDALPVVITYSSDGKRLIVKPQSAGLSSWKLEDGTFASQVPVNVRPIPAAKIIGRNLTMSPDNAETFTGGDDVAIWFSRSGEPLTALSGGADQGSPWTAYSLAVSADGRFLAGTLEDGVHLWHASWQGWLKTACTRLQHHPIMSDTNDPDAFVGESARIATSTCQQMVWSK
jgi:WD40 repeat protein